MPGDRSKMRNRTTLRIVLLLLLIASGTFFFIYYDLHTLFLNRAKVTEFIRSFGPLSALIFIAVQILQVIVAPVPGEVTGLIGGYLFGPVLGTIYSTIGLGVGSWLAFLLARALGLPFVEKVVRRSIIEKYDHFMEHQGTLVSFILFLIPGFPKDSLCYIMGLSHMKTWTFVIIATVGRLFGTIFLSVGGGWARGGHSLLWPVVLGTIGLLLLLAYIFRHKWLRPKSKKGAEKLSE